MQEKTGTNSPEECMAFLRKWKNQGKPPGPIPLRKKEPSSWQKIADSVKNKTITESTSEKMFVVGNKERKIKWG